MPLRSDYLPYPYRISRTHLVFELDAHSTRVTQAMVFSSTHDVPLPLKLNGEQLHLESVRLNEQELTPADYELDEHSLTLHPSSTDGQLTITTTCAPIKNTALSGLFVTGKHLMTQCEAEGFRRITYFADRPDVLSVYTVELIADKAAYPVLLANGNLIEHNDLPDGRHRALWHDPFPKPAYLFAIVAGQLAHIEETVAHHGESKLLQVYVEPHDIPKAQFAMDSLKASMAWDLERYGLPLDLERFMIVATSDFNMGAMENKGLNIFNTACVLAHPETTTDMGFETVEGVVGHEYFHNWTGNRVTCQDWFQLSLKEGLTVYRDQEFTADQQAQGLSKTAAQSARDVQRISNVIGLANAQFEEDAGPMAHPIRPNSYEQINNFYTATVYEKGAEVVRMYETLLGREGFRRGMDLYFKRHDGQAVTCDDFRAAMADANDVDLTQFARWYEQAGTPQIRAHSEYDATTQVFRLHLTQNNPPVGIELQQSHLIKAPLHIPFNVGLLDASGQELLPTQTLNFTQAQQTFVFERISSQPIVSLNRKFGAPVQVQHDYTEAELLTLFAHDTDGFNRWDAGQRLLTQTILRSMDAGVANVSDALIAAFARALNDEQLSAAYRGFLLTLPSFLTVAQHIQKTQLLDPQALFTAREQVLTLIAQGLVHEWKTCYTRLSQRRKPYAYSGAQVGERMLKLLALGYWARVDSGAADSVSELYRTADNMTDRYSALNIAVLNTTTLAQELLSDFYQRFADEALAIDKWFMVQARNTSGDFDSMQRTLTQLMAHTAFENPNPNRLRSLIFTYCNGNPKHFHQTNGAGYEFWAEQVLTIDTKNPQIASRLARACEQWRHFAQPYQEQMQAAYQRIAQSPTLSEDTREIVEKALHL